MMPIVIWLHHRLILLFHDEKGASAVEYGLLVGLIAVAIIVTVSLLGDTLKGLFEGVNTKLAPQAP